MIRPLNSTLIPMSVGTVHPLPETGESTLYQKKHAMDTQTVFMFLFIYLLIYCPCVKTGGWNEESVSIQLSRSVTCTFTSIHTHSNGGVKQCALIKHSHYTQEEIPAGAVYQSFVHFLLLLLHPLLLLLPHNFFFSFILCLPALFTSFTKNLTPLCCVVSLCLLWGVGLSDLSWSPHFELYTSRILSVNMQQVFQHVIKYTVHN